MKQLMFWLSQVCFCGVVNLNHTPDTERKWIFCWHLYSVVRFVHYYYHDLPNTQKNKIINFFELKSNFPIAIRYPNYLTAHIRHLIEPYSSIQSQPQNLNFRNFFIKYWEYACKLNKNPEILFYKLAIDVMLRINRYYPQVDAWHLYYMLCQQKPECWGH